MTTTPPPLYLVSVIDHRLLHEELNKWAADGWVLHSAHITYNDPNEPRIMWTLIFHMSPQQTPRQ